MTGLKVTKQQRSLIKTKSTTKNTVFLEGPAGTGKTTVCVERILNLLQTGQAAADELLILVPQRTLAAPYYDMLYNRDFPNGSQPRIMTLGSLCAETIALFWPLVTAQAGFLCPSTEPTFLNLETSQYYLARLVEPLIQREGLFSAVTIERGRLYSQMIDALNKSAVVGFPHTEVGARLASAWAGDEAQRRAYQELQQCINIFREYCLAHNLLDFSLQVEVFAVHLWPTPECRNYLQARYRHLIVDNVEEDVPILHKIIREWLPACQSALIVYDTDAGYRRFLGADPDSALTLKKLCKRREVFTQSFVMSSAVAAYNRELGIHFGQIKENAVPSSELRSALTLSTTHRFFPDMLEWTAHETARLIHGENVPPNEIVIIAPFFSDALRFSLEARLRAQAVPVRTHRPSRALREQGAIKCVLALARLAHPEWTLWPPSTAEVAHALMQALAGMDLIRAQLLARIVYRVQAGKPVLSAFDKIESEMQARLTFELGERYERLRKWLAAYAGDKDCSELQELPLDHFFSRLFGEILSQPGFGFHNNFEAATHIANLVDSTRHFRQVVSDDPPSGKSIGQEYIEMVQAGVIANQYLREWRTPIDSSAVLLAPAYTFLMRNQPVSYQFWLDIGSRGWAERLYQPLTHPYVLSARWPAGAKWTDADEYAVQQISLSRLTQGLARRCRQHIYLVSSELGEQGYEQRGALITALYQMLRHQAAQETIDV